MVVNGLRSARPRPIINDSSHYFMYVSWRS